MLNPPNAEELDDRPARPADQRVVRELPDAEHETEDDSADHGGEGHLQRVQQALEEGVDVLGCDEGFPQVVGELPGLLQAQHHQGDQRHQGDERDDGVHPVPRARGRAGVVEEDSGGHQASLQRRSSRLAPNETISTSTTKIREKARKMPHRSLG
jgi:hypothetical protein